METRRKTRTGRVVSDKMQNTVIVAVETIRRHPKYGKTIRSVANFKAHDAKGECREGDIVKLVETRPISKLKRWRVAEIMTKGKVVEVKPEELTPEILQAKEKAE